MDDYQNMVEAARHRDWQGCARVMFRRLFFCRAEAQQKIAAETLSIYGTIWNEKYPEMNSVLDWVLNHKADQQQEFPGLPENLDPADTEFESALIEFHNGTSHTLNHARRTIHFANAIRSTVLARQINRWLQDYPAEYQVWKASLLIRRPTFLDDAAAGDEAEKAWMQVDRLFDLFGHILEAREPIKRFRLSSELERVYSDWEQSLLWT